MSKCTVMKKYFYSLLTTFERNVKYFPLETSSRIFLIIYGSYGLTTKIQIYMLL